MGSDQPLLIGTRPLFAPKALAQYLEDQRDTPIPGEELKRRVLADWVGGISGAGVGEGNIEQQFNERILVNVLGYLAIPGERASLYPKPPTAITRIAGTPDVALGQFRSLNDGDFVAIVELKPPGTPLDAPQAGHPLKLSPVDQAFDYGRHILGTKWVLVTDMRVIRLYSVDSPTEFEGFDLHLAAQDADEFRRLYDLLGWPYLCDRLSESAIGRLLAKTATRGIEIQEGFYSAYYMIRADLLSAISDASKDLPHLPDKQELLLATQRLLDRMLFLFYCEDHPDQLIPRGTVEAITQSAQNLPGANPHRVYDALKTLFREVDSGSDPASGLRLTGYNGELFKLHPVIDTIELPDSLNRKQYVVEGPEGVSRRIKGVWGLHGFDFWQEVNEHLLGHIFEQSLSDLVELAAGTPTSLADKLAERKQFGIYYTTELLSDFLTESAIGDLLAQPTTDPTVGLATDTEWIAKRLEMLGTLQIVDSTCGSGAFLSSAYRELLREYRSLLAAHTADRMLESPAEQMLLETAISELTQATLLRDCLFGADLLPQAVELAKLSLWLRSARRGEKISDLRDNIVAADSLDIPGLLALLGKGPGSFDLVVGNPPWGGLLDQSAYLKACTHLDISPEPRWDSWELFVAISLNLLRNGGRLALVLPDTLLSPEKWRTRKLLLEETQIDKLHNLGPDWFGPDVRMGTCVVEAQKGAPLPLTDFRSVMLTGPLRRKVINGDVPLSQVESLARAIPQERCRLSSGFEMELFRSRTDDDVMGRIDAMSFELAEVCDRGRGEEMAKAGLTWECPSCLRITTPGRKIKGGGYANKTCVCGFELVPAAVRTSHLVRDVVTAETWDTGERWPTKQYSSFVDGDDIARRYRLPSSQKQLRLDASEWPYKPAALYEQPKVLIRQAGVGLFATYDVTSARCPQSVYIYRLRAEFAKLGYSHEFVLGCLLSRTMAYYVFKRFGEVDPARAHAKLTHTRLARLPVPRVDFGESQGKELHGAITAAVSRLLSASSPDLGGADDLRVERDLRKLWGLSPEDGAYINGEFAQLPDSQVMRDLFPKGRPLSAIRIEATGVSEDADDSD